MRRVILLCGLALSAAAAQPSGPDWTAAEAEALQHFQEMRASGQFCCLQIDSDFDYVWEISYAWSESLPGVTRHEVMIAGQDSFSTLDAAIENAYSLWKKSELRFPS